MSSQTFIQPSIHRTGPTGSALINLGRRVADGIAASGGQFMQALRESRRRQAEEVTRQYRHLIDDSND